MRSFAVGIALAATLSGQQPESADLLEALGRTASFFSRTATSLTATEVLQQHARKGNMRVLKKGRNDELKEVSFSFPTDFEDHEVVSGYRMGTPAGGGFHEIRQMRTFDGESGPRQGQRHAMTIGAESADDEAKKRILEDLELERLQGAATDFGPILLLFTEARQRNTRFTLGERVTTDRGQAWAVAYRQTTGEGALTEFRDRRQKHHLPEGQIWFRDDDLLPIRITMNTEEAITPKFVLRNEAQVDYRPTPFGLAPMSVVHRQYLNQDLLVENRFTYSDYAGLEIIP